MEVWVENRSVDSWSSKTTSFVLVDPLNGLSVWFEATKAASKGFETSYDKASHTVTLYIEETLAAFNADLTKSFETSYPTVVGRVLNDGATYTNNFTLTVNDAYGVTIVRVTTQVNQMILTIQITTTLAFES